MAAKISVFIIVLTVICLGVAGFYFFESTAPLISPVHVPKSLGKNAHLQFDITDKGLGLKLLTLKIIQGEKTAMLPPKSFGSISPFKGSGILKITEGWDVSPKELGLREAKAKLCLEAMDYSWRNNTTLWQQEVDIDFTPPIITPLNAQNYLNSGGSGMVAFKVNEAVSQAGVQVDNLMFPAHHLPDKPVGEFATLFAIPFDVSLLDVFFIYAVDEAGNAGRAGINHKLFYKKPTVDSINISDGFLSRKMPEFSTRYPDAAGKNNYDTFLWVNTVLRKENNAEIAQICSKQTQEMLWRGVFMRLPNAAPRAGFADERHYIYNGKEIDRANHLGVDLASLANSPVPAANKGRVVFAGYLGIYGNVVILDHGMGLFSLYAHLQKIDVSVGQLVEQEAIIGHTGLTGLAGGDHLHYSMLVNGVFVNPVEWWDPKWIQEKIYDKLAVR